MTFHLKSISYSFATWEHSISWSWKFMSESDLHVFGPVPATIYPVEEDDLFHRDFCTFSIIKCQPRCPLTFWMTQALDLSIANVVNTLFCTKVFVGGRQGGSNWKHLSGTWEKFNGGGFQSFNLFRCARISLSTFIIVHQTYFFNGLEQHFATFSPCLIFHPNLFNHPLSPLESI